MSRASLRAAAVPCGSAPSAGACGGTSRTGFSTAPISSIAVEPSGLVADGASRVPSASVDTSGRAAIATSDSITSPPGTSSRTPAAAAAFVAVVCPFRRTCDRLESRVEEPRERSGRREHGRRRRRVVDRRNHLRHLCTTFQPCVGEFVGRTRAVARSRAAHADRERALRFDHEALVLEPEPHEAAAEAQPERERVPGRRQLRVDREDARRSGRRPAKPKASACQTPPIVARCSAARGRPGQVVEVDPAAMSKQLERLVEPPGAGEQRRRGSPGDSELPCARSRLVEVEVGRERVRRDLLGDEVVEHQHVGLLDDLRAGRRARAPSRRSAAIGRRGASSAITSGSSS